VSPPLRGGKVLEREKSNKSARGSQGKRRYILRKHKREDPREEGEPFSGNLWGGPERKVAPHQRAQRHWGDCLVCKEKALLSGRKEFLDWA